MKKIQDEERWEAGDFEKLKDGLSKDDSAKRHEIRYALFRVQTEASGGNKAEASHHAVRAMIETYEGVGSVEDFAAEWDVGAVSPDICIVKRMWSIHSEHEQMMMKVAIPVTRHDTPETLARKADVLQKQYTAKEQRKAKLAKD